MSERHEFEHPLDFRSEALHPALKKGEEKPKEAEVEIVPDPSAEGEIEGLPDLRKKEEEPEEKLEGEEPKEGEDDEDDEALSKRVQKKINKEVWRRHEAERQATAHQNRAKELEQQLAQFRQHADTSTTTALSAREEEIKARRGAVEQEYLAAAAEMDAAKMFAATQKMAQLAADDKEIEIYKRNRAAQTPKEKPQETQQTQQQPPQADPLAMEWAHENSWFGRDRILTAAAFALDQQLKEEGIPPATKRFYTELDKRLREEFPQKFGQSPKRTLAQPVAGASRAPASTGKLQLTEREFDIARRLGVPPAEYARFKPKG